MTYDGKRNPGYILEVLYEYMHRKADRLEADRDRLYENVQLRRADPLDHLEMILAETRLETAKELFADEFQLLAHLRHRW